MWACGRWYTRECEAEQRQSPQGWDWKERERGRGCIPEIPLLGTSPVTRRAPMKPHFLKVPSTPNSSKRGAFNPRACGDTPDPNYSIAGNFYWRTSHPRISWNCVAASDTSNPTSFLPLPLHILQTCIAVGSSPHIFRPSSSSAFINIPTVNLFCVSSHLGFCFFEDPD